MLRRCLFILPDCQEYDKNGYIPFISLHAFQKTITAVNVPSQALRGWKFLNPYTHPESFPGGDPKYSDPLFFQKKFQTPYFFPKKFQTS